MKFLLPSVAVLVLIGVIIVSVPPGKSANAQTSKPKQLFDSAMEGTFVVTTREGGQGYPIENPKIVSIGGRPFIDGIRSGKVGTHSETMFTGGHTFTNLRYVISIQQVPDAE